MLAGRYPSDEFAELRPRIVWDRVTGVLDRAAGRAAARRHQRRHHPRPRPVRRVPGRPARAPVGGSASSTRRWSTSRGSATSSPSAPPPGGSRTSPTTGCWSRRRPGCPGGCRSGRATSWAARPSWAGPSARSSARWSGSPRPRRAPGSTAAGLDEWAADNLLGLPRRAARGDPARPRRPDHRGRAVPRRARRLAGGGALAVRRPGARPVGAVRVRPDARALRRRRAGHARRRRHRAAAARPRVRGRGSGDRGVGAELLELVPARGRRRARPRHRRDRRVGAVRGPVPRVRRRAPCCCPAAAPTGASRCGSSASGPPSCSRWPASTRRSRSSWRRCASACRTSSTCPASTALMRVDRVARGDPRRRRDRASPRRSPGRLLFGYVAQFLYEGDSPLAETRAAALALDPTLLAELLGRGEGLALRDLLDPEQVARTEAELQRLVPERAARDAEDVADLLRVLGPLPLDEIVRTVAGAVGAQRDRRLAGRARGRPPADPRSGSPARSAGPRSRTPAGCATPSAPRCPSASRRPSSSRCPTRSATWSRRYARTHGPFPAAEVAALVGLGPPWPSTPCAGWCPPAGSSRASCCPPRTAAACTVSSTATPRCCGCCAAARWPPCAPRSSRSPAVELARFLPRWQGVGGRLRGREGLVRAVEQLAGAVLPASALETLVLPARVVGYSPALLDELTSSGEVLWRGHGVAARRRRLGLAAPRRHRPPDPGAGPTDRAPTDAEQAVLDALAGGGAYFFRTLADAVGSTDDERPR